MTQLPDNVTWITKNLHSYGLHLENADVATLQVCSIERTGGEVDMMVNGWQVRALVDNSCSTTIPSLPPPAAAPVSYTHLTLPTKA